MIDFYHARINTAGAYLCIDGLYLFAIGTKLHNGQIPIIRLGGHREEGETAWQCAVREVDEETRLQIKPLFPQTTYLSDGDRIERELQQIQWQPELTGESIPLLVTAYHGPGGTLLSVMFLAQARGYPEPSSEVKGLLLLGKQDIHNLCQKSLTLKQYLSQGGQAILKDEFDTTLRLEPFAQLRLLSRILSMQS